LAADAALHYVALEGLVGKLTLQVETYFVPLNSSWVEKSSASQTELSADPPQELFPMSHQKCAIAAYFQQIQGVHQILQARLSLETRTFSRALTFDLLHDKVADHFSGKWLVTQIEWFTSNCACDVTSQTSSRCCEGQEIPSEEENALDCVLYSDYT
jgi:hypothetical protein